MKPEAQEINFARGEILRAQPFIRGPWASNALNLARGATEMRDGTFFRELDSLSSALAAMQSVYLDCVASPGDRESAKGAALAALADFERSLEACPVSAHAKALGLV